MAQAGDKPVAAAGWLWLLAGGLAFGGLSVALAGPDRLWLPLGLAAVAAFAAILGGRAEAQRRAIDGAGPAEAAISALPALVRDVFEHLPDPLLLLDGAGRIVFANTAMRELIGGAFERRHVSAAFRAPPLLEAVEHTAGTGEPSVVELNLPVPVERIFSAHLSRTALEPRLTTVLLHELTAIRRSERARADFVANASHELRTPLAAVSGFIDTLKGHARDDSEARDRFLDIMSVEAGRMRRLIEDLLSLTRIELNEHVPPSENVRLDEVLRDVVDALSALARKEHTAIVLDAPAGLPAITGDRDELAQLFQNLVHNAIKYGRAGGTVRVAAGKAAGDMLFVSVRDEGEGIAHDAIPRLTERFYRVDVKRSREKGGTGLGLAIVKHIVNRHHGRLQIESEVGQGSTFTVYLPLQSPIAPAAGAAVTEML